MKDRIAFLDGHRGLAILLVIGFHAFSRWATRIPNGDCCAHFPVFEFGWLGVELFFLLSGFVILMTLDRSARATAFFRRRWLRLFPAMLACSLIIYCSAPFFRERPEGAPTLDSLLPGLVFMDLAWLQKFFRHPIQPLEGSFWSLYVEVKFYVFAALVYFRFGRGVLVKSLVGIAGVTLCVRLLRLVSSNGLVSHLDLLAQDFGLDYWFWFAAGAAYYLYRQTGQAAWVRLALGCIVGGACVLGATAHGFLWTNLVGGIAVGSIFAVSMHSERIQAFLSCRFLQFLGFVSYPLYLLHENMLISSLVTIAPRLPREMFPLLPVLMLVPLAAAAFLVARYVEPLLKTCLALALARLGPPVSPPKSDCVQ
jgi:peptidoglycan/LPS O-acetylase OafA/YrhL